MRTKFIVMLAMFVGLAVSAPAFASATHQDAVDRASPHDVINSPALHTVAQSECATDVTRDVRLVDVAAVQPPRSADVAQSRSMPDADTGGPDKRVDRLMSARRLPAERPRPGTMLSAYHQRTASMPDTSKAGQRGPDEVRFVSTGQRLYRL